MGITKEKIMKLEKRAIEEFKIDSILLMENAGMAIYNVIKKYNSYTIICGSGNNGGDGLVLARHLIINNKSVNVFIINECKTPDSKKNFEILQNLTNNIYFIKDNEDLEKLSQSIVKSDVTVDAVFGIGLNRKIEGISKDIINLINALGNIVVSIDLPSGLNPDTKEIYGICVKADETITLNHIKKSLEKSEYAGDVVEVYIGIPGEEFRIYKFRSK